MKKQYRILGHRMVIKNAKINKYDENNPIIILDCRPICCTIPYGLIITCTLKDAKKLIKKEKSNSVIFTKKQIKLIDHLTTEFYSYFEEEIEDIKNTIDKCK